MCIKIEIEKRSKQIIFIEIGGNFQPDSNQIPSCSGDTYCTSRLLHSSLVQTLVGTKPLASFPRPVHIVVHEIIYQLVRVGHLEQLTNDQQFTGGGNKPSPSSCEGALACQAWP
jgi:hypothetical protein